jgi:hypothetical protein
MSKSSCRPRVARVASLVGLAAALGAAACESPTGPREVSPERGTEGRAAEVRSTVARDTVPIDTLRTRTSDTDRGPQGIWW